MNHNKIGNKDMIEQDLTGRTIAQHLCFKLCTILSCSLCNVNEKLNVVCGLRKEVNYHSIWNSTLLINVMQKLSYVAVRDGKHIQPFAKF